MIGFLLTGHAPISIFTEEVLMSNKSTSLSWSDRLALINAYKPSDAAICSALSITPDELNTARDMEANGHFVATKDLDVAAYSNLFVEDSISAPSSSSVGSESISKPTTSLPPQTATKVVVAPKKRGRKGDNILRAFSAIPSNPTGALPFASQHNVSLAVLRQAKRFDRTDLGTVRVKKDKATKELMIWREVK